MKRSRRSGAIAVLALGALLCAPAAANAADAIYGLTDDNRLVRFNSDSPANVLYTLQVQGLQEGETLVALDVRPQNDTLYAVGTSNRVYQVNPVTGAARPAFDPFTPGLNGASFGGDFNPVSDHLRIVSDADQNLRIRFQGGQAGNAQEDSPLQYAAGDPNAGQNPSVGAAAYTNNVLGATETTLYDIDTDRDVLVRQDPENAGTLHTVGALGFNADGQAGFDISPQGNVAYAALRPAGEPNHVLFRIDLSNGRATPAAEQAVIGTEQPIRGIAAFTGGVPDDRTPPEMSMAFSSTILETNTNPLKPSISCDETCTVTINVRLDGRAAGSATETIIGPGRETVEIPINVTTQRRIAQRGTELFRLNVRAVDAAGNVTEQNGRLSRTQTLQGRRAGG